MGRLRVREWVFRGGGVKRKTWGRGGEKVWGEDKEGKMEKGWREEGDVWIGGGWDLGCR